MFDISYCGWNNVSLLVMYVLHNDVQYAIRMTLNWLDITENVNLTHVTI